MAATHSADGVAQVGVVAIGRNEGERLVRCLASLGPLLARTVYVDSGSGDGSVEHARSVGATVETMAPTTRFSAARARNLGFRRLMLDSPDTRFVQFIDGDCQLDGAWIDKAVAFLSAEPDVAIVCGRRREQFPDRSVYNDLCDREWDSEKGEIEECGGDFLARVESFRQVGGFSDHLIAGEEPELCIRLREKGWRIWRTADEMTLHDANITRFSQWWRRTVRAGHAFAEVEALHRGSPYGLWRRNVLRALFWGGLGPLLLAAVVLSPWFLIGLLLYPLQFVRLALRERDFSPAGLARTGLAVLAKPAELQGVVKYYAGRLLRRQPDLIEYK